MDPDSDLDLAITNYRIDSVSVLKNNGDGTFQAKVGYGVGTGPEHVFCADLDADVDLDLAVADHYSGYVSVLKNNGDGTFQNKVNYPVGDYPWSVSCADLDGDTDLDLALANFGTDDVSLLRNGGDGTFQAKVDYGPVSGPYSAFCADLDGDLDMDLAVANGFGGSASILKNLTQLSGNSPPYPFSLLSPADGDSLSNVVHFHWAAAYDPNLAGQIKYDLHISTSIAFHPDSTLSDTNLTVSQHTTTLEDRGTRYWRVKAKDNLGGETWSNQTWSFHSHYLCGDANGDGVVGPGNVVYLINYLFRNGPAPDPLEKGDVNCDGAVGGGDVV